MIWEVGISVGVLFIFGNLMRNCGICNWESKLVVVFVILGICCVWKWILCDNDKIISCCMSCISLVFLDVVLLIIWIIVELFEWIIMVELVR